MFFRSKKTGKYEYLQIVEGYRDDSGKVRQRVLLSLGNLVNLRSTGALDSLLESGARFSEKLAMLSAHRAGKSKAVEFASVGADIVFGRLWKELGIRQVLCGLAADRRFGFDIERAVYHTVIHRLFESGSDRTSIGWRQGVHLEDTDDLELHQLYRAMGFLGDHAGDQQFRTKFSPRRNKDVIEEGLFDLRRDLFTSVDLVFFDTTSIYFEGEGGGDDLGKRGHNKDHRPDLRQMVVGVVLDDKGIPICCEMWPGNTADVTTLKEIVQRFQTCFGIRNVCVVADRGMISAGVLQFLESEESSFSHILGVRMRNVKDVRIEVMSRAGCYHEVEDGEGEKSPMKVKQVVLDGRRYIVCLNEAQARKDRLDRAAIVDSLRKKLREGDKSLVGNKGYRKYLKTSGGHGFAIDMDKLREEERFDGKWVLTTDMDSMSAAEVAIQYKRLWMVENTFRTMKSGINTRPVYHKCEETICGHVFCSFLAILLRRELERRIGEIGCGMEWKDVLRGLEAVEEVTAEISGKTVVFRSELREGIGNIFKAAGVAVPPTVRFA